MKMQFADLRFNAFICLLILAAPKISSGAIENEPKPSAPVSVTRAVGEAGSRIVTSREVSLADAVAQVINAASLDKQKKIVTPIDAAFPANVTRVLDEWTVYFEATEIEANSVDKNEVTRLVKVVTETWKSSPEWNRLEATSQEIKEIVERKLITQAFERLKGNASSVNVTDAEALQYYKKNRLRFGNLPFENFKDNIKTVLVRAQTDRRLNDWRAVLRRKYHVRNFLGA